MTTLTATDPSRPPTELSVGIDFTAVEDVTKSLREHAERYLRRVYTRRELRDCCGRDGRPSARRLAARFAAKESTMKALRVGHEALPWTSIAVRSDRYGAPSLELTGAAEELARERGVRRLDLSLSEHGPIAAAVVLAHLGGVR